VDSTGDRGGAHLTGVERDRVSEVEARYFDRLLREKGEFQFTSAQERLTHFVGRAQSEFGMTMEEIETATA